MRLPINAIRLDGGTQPRSRIDSETVRLYHESLVQGAVFPPVLVFYDGACYWLADGFHRVTAHQYSGLKGIDAIVQQGTREDAQWASFSANRTHGLQRSTADKERAIKAALLHPKGATQSNQQIALHIGCSPSTVTKYRAELESTLQIGESVQRIGQDGRTQNTSNIGKRPASAPAAPETVPAGVDPETGEIMGAVFLPEMLKAAHAPMSSAPWTPPQHGDVMAESRLREASLALNALEHKLSQLTDDDFNLPLAGEALRFRLIATAEEWLRVFRGESKPSGRVTLDMVVDA